MTKLLINKVFSFIGSAYFATLYLITDNLLFMTYSMMTVITFFIFDHFIKTQEIQNNLNKILNYVFFYLDEQAQIQLFSRHKHAQLQDLVNIWFIVENYSKKRYKSYYLTDWDSKGCSLLDSKKSKYIMNYLVDNQGDLENSIQLTIGKQKFLSHLMNNLEEESKYQEIFSRIETVLKDNDKFLQDLDTLTKELFLEDEKEYSNNLSLFLEKI
jgi:hypothetical protein